MKEFKAVCVEYSDAVRQVWVRSSMGGGGGGVQWVRGRWVLQEVEGGRLNGSERVWGTWCEYGINSQLEWNSRGLKGP